MGLSRKCRVAINPKSQVVRRGKKSWKTVVHTAKMLPYEVEKMWPGETTGGRRTGPVVSDRHPAIYQCTMHAPDSLGGVRHSASPPSYRNNHDIRFHEYNKNVRINGNRGRQMDCNDERNGRRSKRTQARIDAMRCRITKPT